jgi:transcriptional regulator with XRE-family HTH domain
MTLYNQTFAAQSKPRATKPMAKKTIEWWKGERLRELRLHKKLSQGKLAKELGVTIQAISNWERSSEAPSSERISQLCTLFSASADYFLGFVDRPYEHIEIEKLPPDEQRLLELYRAGKLPAVLGEILLAQLGSGEDQPRLIEDKTGREPGDDTEPNR